MSRDVQKLEKEMTQEWERRRAILEGKAKEQADKVHDATQALRTPSEQPEVTEHHRPPTT